MSKAEPTGNKIGLGLPSKPFFSSIEEQNAWEESCQDFSQSYYQDCQREVKEDTEILCRRCRQHHIIQVKTWKYLGPPALLKCGPDAWRQLTPVLTLSCEQCGVIYQYPP